MENTTQAHEAIQQLKKTYFTAEDYKADAWQGGMHVKPYLMVCHGCGTFHVTRSSFISSPLSLSFKFADNSMLSVPCQNCGSCPGEVIRDAYHNGSKPEVWVKCQAELGIASTVKI